MTTKVLQEPSINVKHKLSALWGSVMFCFVYGDYFELYVPDKVNGLLTGDTILDTPAKLLTASVVLAIPALMIGLSLLLKAPVSRILNIIFGAFFTLMMLLIAVNSITPWYSFYVFLAVTESIITIFIVFYAWTWPREDKAATV
ncbi:DUF6326 family protein [uncultured Imperialibacter sp.]|uniref:DUF6326 family protein n=1 Tax=uncultured Imperialibacter sp. TaxID=1672639 RepID=UPI0030DD288E|tara:strand:- start:82068 stop:82499 length:432 start_codon:yes stop_codon:yes gene_type:complete